MPEAQADSEKKPRKVKGKVFINKELCKGCQFCVEFCPTHVLNMSEEFNLKGYHPPVATDANACNGCDMCGMYCPDFAIFGIRIKSEEKQ